MSFQPLVRIETPPPQFLWCPRLPLGEISIVEGAPGENKSTLMHYIAAKVSLGVNLPGDSQSIVPARVCVIDTENQGSRLSGNIVANGGDCSWIDLWSGDESFTLPGGFSALETHLTNRPARLLIVDPLNDVVGRALTQQHPLRALLIDLRKLAQRHRLAVVLLRHLTKATGTKALNQGVGSTALSAFARSVLRVMRDPRDRDRRLLVHLKSSSTACAPTLAFTPTPELDGLAVRWNGEVPFDAEELTGKEWPAVLEAKRFLVDLLTEQALPVKDVETAARSACIASRTLRRARESLGILSHRKGVGLGAQYFLALPQNSAVSAVRMVEIDELCTQLIHGSPLDPLCDH